MSIDPGKRDTGKTLSLLYIPAVCAAVLLAGCTAPVIADPILPACSVDQGAKNSTVRIGDVTLQKTTLKEIFRSYGTAQERYSKVEECCIQRAVCYLSPDKHLAVEFGGWAKSSITSYKVTNDPSEIGTFKNCVVSERLAQPVENSIGLKLGMTKVEVIKLLGQPKRKFSTRDDEIEYYFECHPPNLSEDWARLTYILIRFKEDKAVLIRIDQDTQG